LVGCLVFLKKKCLGIEDLARLFGKWIEKMSQPQQQQQQQDPNQPREFLYFIGIVSPAAEKGVEATTLFKPEEIRQLSDAVALLRDERHCTTPIVQEHNDACTAGRIWFLFGTDKDQLGGVGELDSSTPYGKSVIDDVRSNRRLGLSLGVHSIYNKKTGEMPEKGFFHLGVVKNPCWREATWIDSISDDPNAIMQEFVEHWLKANRAAYISPKDRELLDAWWLNNRWVDYSDKVEYKGHHAVSRGANPAFFSKSYLMHQKHSVAPRPVHKKTYYSEGTPSLVYLAAADDDAATSSTSGEALTRSNTNDTTMSANNSSSSSSNGSLHGDSSTAAAVGIQSTTSFEQSQQQQQQQQQQSSPLSSTLPSPSIAAATAGPTLATTAQQPAQTTTVFTPPNNQQPIQQQQQPMQQQPAAPLDANLHSTNAKRPADALGQAEQLLPNAKRRAGERDLNDLANTLGITPDVLQDLAFVMKARESAELRNYQNLGQMLGELVELKKDKERREEEERLRRQQEIEEANRQLASRLDDFISNPEGISQSVLEQLKALRNKKTNLSQGEYAQLVTLTATASEERSRYQVQRQVEEQIRRAEEQRRQEEARQAAATFRNYVSQYQFPFSTLSSGASSLSSSPLASSSTATSTAASSSSSYGGARYQTSTGASLPINLSLVPPTTPAAAASSGGTIQQQQIQATASAAVNNNNNGSGAHANIDQSSKNNNAPQSNARALGPYQNIVDFVAFSAIASADGMDIDTSTTTTLDDSMKKQIDTFSAFAHALAPDAKIPFSLINSGSAISLYQSQHDTRMWTNDDTRPAVTYNASDFRRGPPRIEFREKDNSTYLRFLLPEIDDQRDPMIPVGYYY
jgi:hypothetical protein